MDKRNTDFSKDLISVGRVFESKVKTLLKDDKTKEVVERLEKLKDELRKINPEHVAHKVNLIEKLPKPVRVVIPDFVERLFQTPIEKVLDVIKENYETVGDAVKDIERHLYMARDNLMLDIEEMKIFKQKLEEFISKADERITQLKEELKNLEEEKRKLEEKEPSEDVEKKILEIDSQLFDLSQEIQDLETVKQAVGQGIISVHQIIDTNTALIKAVERTIRVSKITINVGIVIRQAIANQSKAIKAVQDTQKFASDLLLSNAKALKHQTKEVKDLYTQPVLALDKVKEAYETLVQAIEEFEDIKKKGYEIAVENIKRLEDMNRELEKRLLTSSKHFADLSVRIKTKGGK